MQQVKQLDGMMYIRIASISKLALLVEDCIESHFLLNANWKVIVMNLSVPELSEPEYLRYCLENTLILTLYTYRYIVWRSSTSFSVQQSNKTTDKIALIDALLKWSKELNPSKIIGKEQKIFIIWFKTIELLAMHLRSNPNDRNRVWGFEVLIL